MDSNLFFKKKKFKVKKLFPKIKINQDFYIDSVKPLHLAKKKDITFFDSIKYKDLAVSTSASYCITNKKLEKFLPSKINCIIVENVLLELAKVLKMIYPDQSQTRRVGLCVYPECDWRLAVLGRELVLAAR